MPYQLANSSQPCIWMCAGQISYRLCDRNFDCENCPLDAALRGRLPDRWRGVTLNRGQHPAALLPHDRLYTAGHIWVQPLSDARTVWRTGVDALAAELIGSVRSIEWRDAAVECERGEPVCDIVVDLGIITIGAPLRGRVLGRNEALAEHPAMLIADPYDAGWLLELASVDDAGIGDLLSSHEACKRATTDRAQFHGDYLHSLQLFIH